MNKSEKEILKKELKSAKGLLAKAKADLAFFKTRLDEKPWDANWDKAVKDQEHLIGVLEFRIKNLKTELK